MSLPATESRNPLAERDDFRKLVRPRDASIQLRREAPSNFGPHVGAYARTRDSLVLGNPLIHLRENHRFLILLAAD